MTTLSDPGRVLARLEDVENELAEMANAIEDAALAWFRSKRDREKMWAEVYLRSDGTVEARKALATQATIFIGKEEEALYEALRAKSRVLDTAASVGMAILKSMGRA